MPGKLTSPIRALGVLTGGGDVPGLNAAIKALVYRAAHLDISISGLRMGWEGITFLDRSHRREELIFNPQDPQTWERAYLVPLNRLNTRTIDRMGGTILQSTRTNPARMRAGDLPPNLASYGKDHAPDDRVDLTAEVLANLHFLELDGPREFTHSRPRQHPAHRRLEARRDSHYFPPRRHVPRGLRSGHDAQMARPGERSSSALRRRHHQPRRRS